MMEGQINLKIKDLENRYQDKQYKSQIQNEQQQSNTMKELQMNKFGQNQIIWEPQLNYERDLNSNSAYRTNNQQSVDRPSFYQKVDKYKLQQFSPTLNYPQHINQDQENGNEFSNFSSNRYSEDLKKYLGKNTINSNSTANIGKKVDQTVGADIQSDLTDAAQEYGQVKMNNFMNKINQVSVLNESSKKVVNSESVVDNIKYQTQTNFDKNIFQNSSQNPQRQQNFEKSPDPLQIYQNQDKKSPKQEENQNAQKDIDLDNDAIMKKTYEILNQKAPSKYEAIQNDQNDKIKTELFDLIENFEKIFVNFINNNYRSFTEKQVHQLIHDELKIQIKNMLKKLQPNDMFQKCDPFKIESILQNIDNLWNSHEQIKNYIHKFGTSVNTLAQASFKLKEDAFYHDRLDPFMLDINENITVLNVTYNDVHYKVMQNFLELGNIKEICINTLSSQGFLKKFDDLEKQYDRLQMQHTQLKQQLFEQTVEFKNLQSDFDLAKKIADQNKTDNFRVKNMEQIVNEYREEINKLKDKCQELKTSLFDKERECDRLNHTLKHGISVVGAGIGISPTFDHSYAGPGGSIATGQLNLSKVEISIQHQKLISELKVNQLKWRSNCENIIRLSNRFLTSMRLLQKIVHHSKSGQNDQQLKVQKMEFETHKKALEMTLENVQKQINDSLKDVIVQGPQFGNMEQNVNFDSRTSENLKKIKNILDFQSQKQSYNFQDQRESKSQNNFLEVPHQNQKGNEHLAHNVQNENQQNNIQSPTIKHYKPQELIRMELETSQLQSEMETLKNFNQELEKKVEHLTKSLIENNQKQFLSEKENQRLHKMNEQILREKVEIEVKSSHQIKQLDEKISKLKNQSTEIEKDEDDLNGKNILKQFKNNGKKVQFKEDNDQDDFELNILKVRDGNREGRDIIKYSEMNTFHVDQSMNSLAQSIKKKSYQGDPFKNPDPFLVKQEDAQDERNDINKKLINLLEEKEDFIKNLTVQKQKLKDMIDEMERQQKEHIDQITSLNEEILKWQNVELEHQELERLREDHSYQREVIGKNIREIDLLKSQIERQDLILNEQYQSRITAQQDQYDKLQHQFTQERSEFIRQSKLTHDLEMNIINQNDQLLALQKNHTDQLRIREDLEIQVHQLGQQLKANQGDHEQVQFLQIKLKQFDKQIIENQDFIQVLQRDLVTFQERNKELTDRINVINYRQEEAVRERVQAYQDEILKITEQFNFEISQLKKDLLQKSDEIQYHQKSLQLKEEYIKNALQNEIEKIAQKRNESQQQELNLFNSNQDQLQIANQTIQRIQGELMQERKSHLEQIKEMEQKWQIIENNLIDQLKIQGNELKKMQNQLIAGDKPNELFFPKNQEIQENQDLQNANDIALEKLAIENNELKKQLQRQKEQEDLSDQSDQPVLKEIPKNQENNVEYLQKELKIAQSQIYENNKAHLKQIKSLRQRLNMDEYQLQQELDQHIQKNQELQDQIENHIEELSALNEKYEEVSNENQNFQLESQKLNENNELLQKQFQQNKHRLDEEIMAGAKLMSENQNLQSQAKQTEVQNVKLNQEINLLKNQKLESLNNENVFNKLILDKNLENQNLKSQLEQLQSEIAKFKKDHQVDNEEMINNFVDIKQKNMELQETIEDLEIEKQKMIQDFENEKKQIVLDLEVEQQKLRKNILELQSENRVLEQTKSTLEQRVQEMEQEKEEAFWNQKENSEFNQSQKSSHRSAYKKIDGENLNKLNEFMKQLEEIQNEIKLRQEEVQMRIENQFKLFPSIEEVKQAYILQNFSQIKNRSAQIIELLNNNDIKLVQKPIAINNKKYLIVQSRKMDDNQINEENDEIHMICENELSKEQLDYILSYLPEMNQQSKYEDSKINDAMNQYIEQNLDLKKQLDLLKVEYQVFLNEVLAQSDDIDNVEVIELEYQKEENQHFKKLNFELQIQNKGFQMANSELKKRLEDVNGILKQFFEVQNKDLVDNSIVSNKNEQQISANSNFLDILNNQQNEDDQFARGSSLKSENDLIFKSKVNPMIQAKSSIIMFLKQIPLQFNDQNLALLEVLFQNLSLSEGEIEEVIESIQQKNEEHDPQTQIVENIQQEDGDQDDNYSNDQIDFESIQVD